MQMILRVILVLALAVTPPRYGVSEEQVSTLNRVWSLLEQFGIITVVNAFLGEGGADRGAIWVTELTTGERRPLTQDSDFSWPVFGIDAVTVFALRRGQLVRLDPSVGDPVPVGSSNQLEKLIGVAADGSILAILPEGPLGRPALVAPDGSVTALPLPETSEDKRRIAVLLGESRAFANGSELLVDRAENAPDPRRRGFDVYLVRGGERRNLSECGSNACGQPSMVPGGDRVLYIRSNGSQGRQ